MAWVAALAFAFVATRAAAASDPRELKAREDFAAGRYQQALDVFAKLYAETLHPVYLRNIGRCYQNLGDPDRALISFRDYLRKHRAIAPEERTEVEGFIAEMEALKTEKGARATESVSSIAPLESTSTITPLPSASASAPASSAAPEALVTAPAAHPGEGSSPIYTRWWFWTLVAAAAVGAGLGIAAAAGAFTTTQDGACMRGYTCQ
jgi:tetratricopeptide (TPR) repeat protein